MMNKSEISKLLKNLGVGSIKASSDNGEKTIAKGQKGIAGGSVGPMTATTAYLDKNSRVENKVHNELILNDFNPTSKNTYEIAISPSQKRILRFYWSLFPAHTGNHYDSAYKNYYYIVCTEDKKI